MDVFPLDDDLYVSVTFSQKGFTNMELVALQAIKCKTVLEMWILSDQRFPFLLAYGHARHMCLSYKHKETSLIKTHIEGSNTGPWAKLQAELGYFVDFIADVVAAFLDKDHVIALVELFVDGVSRVEPAILEDFHELDHQLLVSAAIPIEERVLLKSFPAWRRPEYLEAFVSPSHSIKL